MRSWVAFEKSSANGQDREPAFMRTVAVLANARYLLGLLIVAFLLCGSPFCHGQQSISLVSQLGPLRNFDSSFALSHDGAILCTTDGLIIRLWDVKSGLQLKPLIGVTGDSIEAVRFTRDGKWLAAASRKALHFWNLTTGKEEKTFRPAVQKFLTSIGHDSFTPYLIPASMTFTRNEKTIVMGELGGFIIFDLFTGSVRENDTHKFLDIDNQIHSVSLFPDEKTILIASERGHIQRWSLDGTFVKEFDTESRFQPEVVVSRDGSFIADISTDEFAKIMNPETGKERYRLPCPRRCAHISLAPDDQDVVVTGFGESTVWDARTGTQKSTLANDDDAPSFSADGKLVAVSASFSEVTVLDYRRNTVVGHISSAKLDLAAAATSESNDRLVLTDKNSTAYVWNLKTGRLESTMRLSGIGESIAVSKDGQRALIGMENGTCSLVNLVGGKELLALKTGAGKISATALSPDGSIGACSGETKYNVSLLDLEKGTTTDSLPNHTKTIKSLLFSRDGKFLVSASKDSTAVLWDIKGRFIVRRFGRESDMAPGILGIRQDPDVISDLLSAMITPDDAFVVTASTDGRLTIWDAKTGHVIKLLNIGKDVSDVKLSFDGKRLISTDLTGNLTLRSFPSGVVLRRYVSGSNGAGQVMFPSDQSRIVSSGGDSLVRIWDTASAPAVTSSNQPMITLTTTADNWAVADSFGRFDTNDLNGQAPMHWILSDAPTKPLAFELFVREYFTPGLLARAYQKLPLPRVTAQSNITNRLQPTSLITAIEKSATSPDRVDVTISVESETAGSLVSGVRDLRLFRDGRLVRVKSGEVAEKQVRFQGIMLPHGRDHVVFTAYAYNDVLIRGKIDRKNYSLPVGPVPTPKAFLINVSVNYSSGVGCGLTYAVNDAKELQRAISTTLAERFVTQPTLLVSTDASANVARKEDLKQALAQVVKSATPDDVVFVTFSGHGYTAADGTFYLFPSDTQGNCGMMDAQSFSSAISAAELSDWLQDIDGAELVLILDACSSAGAVLANDFRPAPLDSPGLGQLAYDKRFEILAASQRDERTKEYENLKHGLLSYLLLKGLETQEADWHPPDGKIELAEWLSYPASVMTTIDPASLGPLGTPKPVIEALPITVKRDRDLVQGPELFNFDPDSGFILR